MEKNAERERKRKTWGTCNDPHNAEYRAPKFPMPKAFVREVVRRAGAKVITEEETRRVREIARDYDMLQLLVIQLIEVCHKPEKAQAARVEAILSAGDYAAFMEFRAADKFDLRNEARERVRMVKNYRREHTSGTVEIAEAVTQRIQEAAKILLEKEESAERARCEEWKLPVYEPSLLVRTLRQMTWLPERMIPTTEIAAHPRDVLAVSFIDWDEIKTETKP